MDLPDNCYSDYGRQFTSECFKTCCKAMGVQHIFTSEYHPQANGQVERFNRTILARLRALVGEEQGTLDLYSSAVTYAYNTQVHASTGYAPFDLTLTRPPPLSEIVFSDSPTPVCFTEVFRSERDEPKNLRDRIRQKLASQLPRVRENLARAVSGTNATRTEMLGPTTQTTSWGNVWLRDER
jgi:transposase InsO family protein